MIDRSFIFKILEYTVPIDIDFYNIIKSWPLNKYDYNNNSYYDNLNFHELKKIVNHKLDKIFKENNCYLFDAWIQSYNNNQFHDLHLHPESFMSFVWYIDCTDISSETIFFNPGYPYIEKNKLSVKPEKGKLILFDSALPHHALPNKDNQRLIISGNCNLITKPS